MIRVTVELVPFGDNGKAKKIGEMVIANTGSVGGDTASYEAWIGPDDYTKSKAIFGRLENFDRSKGAWELIRLLTEACLLEDHKEDKKKDSHCQRLKKKLGAGR